MNEKLKPNGNLVDVLKHIDLSAFADKEDKLEECEYFLGLASHEPEIRRFRWLVSAFLNAVFSYFEIAATNAIFSSSNDDGEMCSDEIAVDILKQHIDIKVCETKTGVRVNAYLPKNANAKLALAWRHRNSSTHDWPLSIRVCGKNTPEDFCFGHDKRDSVRVLPLCREVMNLIRTIESEIRNS